MIMTRCNGTNISCYLYRDSRFGSRRQTVYSTRSPCRAIRLQKQTCKLIGRNCLNVIHNLNWKSASYVPAIAQLAVVIGTKCPD